MVGRLHSFEYPVAEAWMFEAFYAKALHCLICCAQNRHTSALQRQDSRVSTQNTPNRFIKRLEATNYCGLARIHGSTTARVGPQRLTPISDANSLEDTACRESPHASSDRFLRSAVATAPDEFRLQRAKFDPFRSVLDAQLKQQGFKPEPPVVVKPCS